MWMESCAFLSTRCAALVARALYGVMGDNHRLRRGFWHVRRLGAFPITPVYRQEGESLARRLGGWRCALSRFRPRDAGQASEAGGVQAPPRHRVDAPVRAPVTRGPRLRASARGETPAPGQTARLWAAPGRRGTPGRGERAGPGGPCVPVTLIARAPADAAAW